MYLRETICTCLPAKFPGAPQTKHQYINNNHRYLKIRLPYAMQLGALVRMNSVLKELIKS